MKVIFLGTGEAFDPELPNNSHLVLSKTKLLLDCGYDAVKAVWKYSLDPDFIDAIFISHPHADHYFGLAPLLESMDTDRRRKSLAIICKTGMKGQILQLLDFGYRGFVEKLGYELQFVEVSPMEPLDLNELSLTFAPTEHSVPNLAVRITDGTHTICYSGDGQFTDASERLYNGAVLVIHEGYQLTKRAPNHTLITPVLEMAMRANVACLALTHINKVCRREEMEAIKTTIKEYDLKVIIPEPGEEYTF